MAVNRPKRPPKQDNGIEGSTILASVLNFDPALFCDSDTFQPCSEKALANHKVVTDASGVHFPINGASCAYNGQGITVGKFPAWGDYRQNPNVGLTLAAAEQLYDALYVWGQTGFITVTEMSLDFFKQLEEKG